MLTPRYQLIENYQKRREIPILVTNGHINEGGTLDHIVMVNKKQYVVRAKPTIPFYDNYRFEIPYTPNP
jgi:hypothetical protein